MKNPFDLGKNKPRMENVNTVERVSLWDIDQPGMCLLVLKIKGRSEPERLLVERQLIEEAVFGGPEVQGSAGYGEMEQTNKLQRLLKVCKALLADLRVVLPKNLRVMEQKEADAQLQLSKAKAAYEDGMARYQTVVGWNEYYDQHIRPSVSLFKAMTEDIGCFAICEASGEDVQLRACILNRQEQIRYLLQKHKAELTRLEQDAIKPFPTALLQKPKSTDAAVCSVVQPVPEPDQMAEDCEALQRAMEQRDIASMKEAGKRLQAAIRNVDVNTLRMQIQELEERIEEKEKQEQDYIVKQQQVTAECEKRLRYLEGYEQHWSYCLLLKALVPFFREAAAPGEEELLTAAPQLQHRLTEIIEQFNQNPGNGRFAFCWKRHDELPRMKMGAAALGYTVHPVLWPGLCAYLKDQPGEMICVVPGHTPPAE